MGGDPNHGPQVLRGNKGFFFRGLRRLLGYWKRGRTEKEERQQNHFFNLFHKLFIHNTSTFNSFVTSMTNIWRFPEIGAPPNHPV